MQTFLPYEDFRRTAACLDTPRLGKQRVETLQILHVLTGKRTGWQHHPAVVMWRGYEHALCEYGLVICEEWVYERFHVDSCMAQILRIQAQLPAKLHGPFYPRWLGDIDFHLSHQSNLLRKNPEHYSKYFAGVKDNLRYLWPVSSDSSFATKESDNG